MTCTDTTNRFSIFEIRNIIRRTRLRELLFLLFSLCSLCLKLKFFIIKKMFIVLFSFYALLSYIIQENVSPGTIAIVPFTNTKVRKIGQKWISSHYCSTCRECGAHPRSEGRNTRFLCPRGVNGKKNAFSEHAGWWLRAPPRPSQTHRVYTVVTYLPSFPYCA